VKLVKDDHFTHRLMQVVTYIAKDSKSRARQFSRDLQRGLDGLKTFPYKCRRSFYYENEQIRDYIFKGYTIPYYIDEENEKIVILDIFKWTEEERK